MKTTGELRTRLAEILDGVAVGKIEPTKAQYIAKLAAQINESFYSELKMARFRYEMRQSSIELGDVPIGGRQTRERK